MTRYSYLCSNRGINGYGVTDFLQFKVLGNEIISIPLNPDFLQFKVLGNEIISIPLNPDFLQFKVLGNEIISIPLNPDLLSSPNGRLLGKVLLILEGLSTLNKKQPYTINSYLIENL